jgi:trehalose-6-phosphate synthase
VLPVAPADIEGLVRALHEALAMPADQRAERAAAARAQVEEHDLTAWLAAQFTDLLALG